MTEEQVREIAGEAAFPRVWEIVARAMKAGYEPIVRINKQGHIEVGVTAILREWAPDDEDEEE